MGNGNVMTNTSRTSRSRTRGVLPCELFVLSLGILHITFYSAKVSECKNYNFLPLRLFVKYPKMDAYRYAAAGGHTALSNRNEDLARSNLFVQINVKSKHEQLLHVEQSAILL